MAVDATHPENRSEPHIWSWLLTKPVTLEGPNQSGREDLHVFPRVRLLEWDISDDVEVVPTGAGSALALWLAIR